MRSVLREFFCTGDDNKVVIPVPIPNTEVKHFRGENTLYGEDSSLPVLFIKNINFTQVIKPDTVIWKFRGQRSIIDLTFMSKNLIKKVIEYGLKKNACHGFNHLPVMFILDIRFLYTLSILKHA